MFCSLLVFVTATHAADLEQTLRKEGSAIASKLTLADVPTLIDLLDKNDPNTVKAARETLMRYTHRVANTDRQIKLATVLCQHLGARDKHKTATRITLCRALGFVGESPSATVLYKAMNERNPPLQEMARRALVRNSSANGTNALIGGLQTSAGDLLVGVINGLGERGDLRAVNALANHIYNRNAPPARAALDALARLPHPMSVKAVQAAFQDKKPGATDALLDLANNLIDNDMSSEARAALIPLVDNKDLAVAQRCRWLYGLGRIGGDIPTQFVMRTLEDDNTHVRGAALEACVLLPGEDATTTIARKAQAVSGSLKLNLIALLGRRGNRMSDAAADFLLKAISDEDLTVRTAAIDAVAAAGIDRGIGAIIAVLDEPDNSARQAAERAVSHMPGQFVTKQIIYTLRGQPGAKRAPLVRALGRRGDKVALEPLLEAATDTDPAVQAAGIEALGQFGAEEKSDVLLTVAKTGTPAVAQTALVWYLRFAKRTETADRPKAGCMFISALRLAKNDKQHRDALVGIRRNVDDPPTDIVDLIAPLLHSANVRDDAAATAIKLAITLPADRRDQATDLLMRVARSTAKDDLRTSAIARLAERGIGFNPAQHAGFITTWQIIGPFPNRDNAMWDASYPPEKAVTLDQPVELDTQTLHWKKYHTPELDGTIDMGRAMVDAEHVGAYAYSEITVDKDQDVLLKVGSDDGIAIWLNGQPVHAKNTRRVLKIDQDTAKAHLNKGTNAILVKILNGVYDWGFCLRVTSPTSEPVTFKPMN